MPAHRSIRAALVVAATAALVAFGVAVPQAAQAATIDVADQTQLQNAANTALAGDTINITADIALTATVTFPTGVIVQGDTPTRLISRQNNVGLTMFEFAPTGVLQAYTVQNLTFDGSVGTGIVVNLDDGAIDVSDATFSNVSIHDNDAGGFSAIYVERITSDFIVTGGSNFQDNSTNGDGAAIGGAEFFNTTVKIEHSFFDGNDANGSGGAVALNGVGAFGVTIDDNSFTGNTSGFVLGGGGAVYTTGQFTTVTLSNDDFEFNSAFGSGGGAYLTGVLFGITVTDSTFTGNQATILDGGGAWISAGSTLRVDGSDFDSNTAGGSGGGLLANSVAGFTMAGDTFTTNTAPNGFGGGMRIPASGSIDFDGLTVTGNTANVGGGISVADMGHLTGSVFTGNSAVNAGGGIAVDVQSRDFATSTNTFSGNQVTGFGNGAATYIASAVDGSAIRFYASTYSGNQVASGSLGASLAVDGASGDVFYEFLEDTFNETISDGPVMYIASVPTVDSSFTLGRSTMIGLSGGVQIGQIGGPAELNNLILDGDSANTGQPSLLAAVPVDTSWSIVDEAANGNYNDITGNQFGTADAQLGPLQNNGGPTFTRLPLTGSPAIDMGDPNPGPLVSNDQRGTGFPRIVNGRLDIGAVEVQRPVLAATGAAFPWGTLYVGLFGLFTGLALIGADRRWMTARA